MIKALRNVDPSKLLFIDIETRAGKESISKEENPEVWEVLEYMTRYRREAEGFDSIEDFYEEKAPLFAELGAICCISVGVLTKDKLRVKSFYGEEEMDFLPEFKEFLDTKVRGYTPCYFSGFGFDVPFIVKRMWANEITEIPQIFDFIDEKPWLVDHVELKDIGRANSYYTPSLLSMSYMLGLPSPKATINGGEVNRAFWDGRIEEIREYCERDVLTTANIFLKLTGRDIVEMEVAEVPIEQLPLIQRIHRTKSITKEDEKEIKEKMAEVEDADKFREILKAAVTEGVAKVDKPKFKQIDKIIV